MRVHYNFRTRLAMSMRRALDVVNAFSFALRVEEHMADHGIAD